MIRFFGLDQLVRKVSNFADVFERERRALDEEMAQLLLDTIRDFASHPPGPNVESGSYRASWAKRQEGDGKWVVFSNAPQARRLEYGFVGTDSLGRLYNQAARPHVRPAEMKVKPIVRARYAALPKKVWRSV